MARPAGEHRVGLLAQEEPPATTRADSMTAKVLALVPELRGHLGDWYRIAEFTGASTAGTVAKKLREAHPGKIEARPVRPEAGGSVLYARWVGNRQAVDR